MAKEMTPIGDEDMGYVDTFGWSVPTTQEHPTNTPSDAHAVPSGWWTKEPKGGQA